MAASILSQDILSICLFLANGNIELSMAEVAHRAEKYQGKKDRHFGISRSDFRSLFHLLVSSELKIGNFESNLVDVKLSDIITDILNYSSAHFNDEGEHWLEENKKWNKEKDSLFIEHWYGYDVKQYQEKLIVKQEMKNYFGQQEITTLQADSVKKFMKEIKISEAILLHCSRLGESS